MFPILPMWDSCHLAVGFKFLEHSQNFLPVPEICIRPHFHTHTLGVMTEEIPTSHENHEPFGPRKRDQSAAVPSEAMAISDATAIE